MSVVFSPGVVFAGTKGRVVEIRSDGIEVSQDLAVVRQTAIDNALEKAVAQVVGTFISSATVTQHQETLQSGIYAKAKNYILNYNIASEGADSGVYTVVVKALVSSESVMRDLQQAGIVSTDEMLPLTLILAAEQDIGQARPMYRTRQTEPLRSEVFFRASFSEDGYPLIDRKTVADTGGIFDPDAENSQVAYLGRQCGADLVVVTRSIFSLVPGSEGTVATVRVRVEGHAVATEDGVTVGKASSEEVGQYDTFVEDGGKLLEKVIAKVSAVLKRQARLQWEQPSRRNRGVSLSLSGIEQYSDYQKIKTMLLRDIKGIKNVCERRMGRGNAVLAFDIDRNILSVADELAVRAFDDFSLEVINVGTDHIEIRIVR